MLPHSKGLGSTRERFRSVFCKSNWAAGGTRATTGNWASIGRSDYSALISLCRGSRWLPSLPLLAPGFPSPSRPASIPPKRLDARHEQNINDLERFIRPVDDKHTTRRRKIHEIRMRHVSGLAIGHVDSKWKEGSCLETATDFLARHETRISNLSVGGNVLEINRSGTESINELAIQRIYA